MPRPRVRLQDRQRSVKACAPCKRSKIRCDAELPCAMCVRRGRQADCTYDGGRDAAPDRHRRASHATAEVWRHTPADTHSDVDPMHDEREDSAATDAVASSVRDEICSPRGRTLLSASMQKGKWSAWQSHGILTRGASRLIENVVYVGATASISYLQFLRRVVRHRIGACAFTESNSSNFMLETGVVSCVPEAPILLNTHQLEALVQSFYVATSGVLDLYSKEEILTLLRQQQRLGGGAMQSARVYLSLAVGAQSRGHPQDAQLARELFSKGRALAFQSMLVDPSLEMVSDFLIMAFYMLGACNRNAGYMYLGVACKAASALGLHRVDQYRDIEAEERRLRLSAWKSCRVLDMIVNSILGRSSGSPTSGHEEQQLHAFARSLGESSSVRVTAMQATFDLCPFMDELERHGGVRSAASAEDSLRRLQAWSKGLPPELRRWTGHSPTAASDVDQEHYVGAMHVACMYYFAVILTTRRFLTLHLMPRTHGTSRSGNFAPHVDAKEMAESEGLAQVCLTAAISLATVGANARKVDRMLPNMCIMKAWMFAAGLLLGFALFAQLDDSDREIEDAFHQARDVLRFLAATSPQAEHYHGILTSLGEAVVQHRARAVSHRRRTASRYLDQLFTTTDLPDSAPSSLGTDHSGLDAAVAGRAPLHMDGLDFSFARPATSADADYAPFPDLGPLASDDFALGWQPFAPMFDDLL